jgi:hypothetical protein
MTYFHDWREFAAALRLAQCKEEARRQDVAVPSWYLLFGIHTPVHHFLHSANPFRHWCLHIVCQQGGSQQREGTSLEHVTQWGVSKLKNKRQNLFPNIFEFVPELFYICSWSFKIET